LSSCKKYSVSLAVFGFCLLRVELGVELRAGLRVELGVELRAGLMVELRVELWVALRSMEENERGA
jgi:hypothetical protein